MPAQSPDQSVKSLIFYAETVTENSFLREFYTVNRKEQCISTQTKTLFLLITLDTV